MATAILLLLASPHHHGQWALLRHHCCVIQGIVVIVATTVLPLLVVVLLQVHMACPARGLVRMLWQSPGVGSSVSLLLYMMAAGGSDAAAGIVGLVYTTHLLTSTHGLEWVLVSDESSTSFSPEKMGNWVITHDYWDANHIIHECPHFIQAHVDTDIYMKQMKHQAHEPQGSVRTSPNYELLGTHNGAKMLLDFFDQTRMLSAPQSGPLPVPPEPVLNPTR
ncbi:hypothetical protein EDB89DRAFT_1907721 [Lactarius sanguifluus]|nr:hypothetical protein EDB89DRAFT_1907721 [Lactarius sanguifluus]